MARAGPAPAARSPSRPYFVGRPSRSRRLPAPGRYRARHGRRVEHPGHLRLGHVVFRSRRAAALKSLFARVSAHVAGKWRHAEVRFMADRIAAEWVYPAAGSPAVEPDRTSNGLRCPTRAPIRSRSGRPPASRTSRPDSVGQHSARRRRAPPGRRPLARSRPASETAGTRATAISPCGSAMPRRSRSITPGGIRTPAPSHGKRCPSPSAIACASAGTATARPCSTAVRERHSLFRAGAAGRPHAVRDSQHRLCRPHARALLRFPGRPRRAGRESARRRPSPPPSTSTRWPARAARGRARRSPAW